MIIKFSLVRLSIIFLSVILFPLVQKQWLNLYLFDTNNFSIYKLLYYLSGLFVPILVIINSLNKFTYYKFNYHNNNNSSYIKDKLLFFISFLLLITLSSFISYYFLLNLKLFLELFINNNEYLLRVYIDKQIIFIIIISILLIFKKTKLLIKKFILTNFFIFSIIIWYSQINDSLLTNIVPIYMFKSMSINIINITILLAIEMLFYLWSYISYSSYLTDWSVPKPYKKEILSVFYIIIFYLIIINYYSILY